MNSFEHLERWAHGDFSDPVGLFEETIDEDAPAFPYEEAYRKELKRRPLRERVKKIKAEQNPEKSR